MKFFSILLVMIAVIGCYALDIPDVWLNVRNSAYTNNSEMYIQFESIDYYGIEHRISYNVGGLWQYIEPENINDLTFQAILQANPEENLKVHFSSNMDVLSLLNPGFLEDDITVYTEEQLLKVADYAIENLDTPFLEIIADYVSYSENKFYTAIKNNGGGFPTSASFIGPFYAYATTFAIPGDLQGMPEEAYILVHTVSLPPIISSGLYKVNIDTFALDYLGDIETHIIESEDLLVLSCDIDVLLADPDFYDWINSDFGEFLFFNSMTLMISDFGQNIEPVDNGAVTLLRFKYYEIEPFDNVLPEITDVWWESIDGVTSFWATYFDEDGHFPIITEIEIQPGENLYQLTPLSLDFNEEVVYTAIIDTHWEKAEIRFSDDGENMTTYKIINTSAEDVVLIPEQKTLRVYPNPFNPNLTGSNRSSGVINFSFYSDYSAELRMDIYNVRGQKITSKQRNIDSGEVILNWNGFEGSRKVPNGLYLVKIEVGSQRLAKKFMIMR